MCKLKLIFHLQDGKVETFSVKKDSVSIGRGAMCDVVLPYEGFSRKHAQIDIINGEVFVTDLASTNGVFIDGERIAPSQKKQIQSFFNLQIGPAQQVEVIDDETIAQEALISRKTEITKPQVTNVKMSRPEQTRTTRMDPSLLKPAPRKREAKKENKNALIALPLIVLLGAGYYYFTNSEEVAGPEAAPAAVAAEAPLTETDFLSATVLDSTYKNASCSNANWCEDARVLAANKEGVVIEGKTLVVYFNMDAFINETHSEGFNALDVKKRLEILTLRRIFHSNLLRSFLRQKTLDTVQVVAGTIKEDQYSPFIAFKFKRDLDPAKIEKFYIFGLFDRALNEGKTDALIDISLVYDKMDL